MTTTRFPTLLVLPATLWLVASLGDKDCSITRPGGVKEPGVTNTEENVAAPSTPIAATGMTARPTPGRADGAKFYTTVSKH